MPSPTRRTRTRSRSPAGRRSRHICDGEKLAVVTDRGEFGLYGLALDGNSRRPACSAFRRRRRVRATSDRRAGKWFWRKKARSGSSPRGELRQVPLRDQPWPRGCGRFRTATRSRSANRCTHPQVNGRGDTFVVVTQDGMACRATAVDAVTGEVRWRRELGLMAKGDPIRIGDAIVVLDQGGGFYRIDVKKLSERGGAAWLVEDRATRG